MTPLPPALHAELLLLNDPTTGQVHAYRAGPPEGTPLLLVHSVNAAASAFEVKPLFEHYRSTRPTYALDLPGFGLSERSARRYTPRLMTDAIHRLVREIRRREGDTPIDALALSLSCEFLARAATEDPASFRTLSLVSPTGLEGRPRLGPPGATREVPGLYRLLSFPLWSNALYRNLTRPGVIRYFLERTWGGPGIDEGLWAYDVQTVRAPGALHAPLDFLCAALFSADIGRIYQSLGLPVWLSHGSRGDFVRFRGARELSNRDAWTTTPFDTGAMPYFEVPGLFFEAFEAFLKGAQQSGQVGG
jgi:pimeloyl-ACP methyl ester carboxylesterase